MQIKVKVKPNSKREEVIYDKDKDIYVVYVKEKAENNRANISVLRLMNKRFNKRFRIVRGKRAREKVLCD